MICFEKAGFSLIKALFLKGLGDDSLKKHGISGFLWLRLLSFSQDNIKISTPRVSRSTLQPELTSLPFDLNDFLSFICRIGRLRMQVFKFNSDRFFPP